MWFIRFFTFILLFLASSCGFKPLYTTHEAVHFLKKDIWVDTIPEREGQELRTYLMMSMGQPLEGPSEKVLYRLRVNIKKYLVSIGYLPTDTTTYAQYSLLVHYALIDEKTKQVVFQGNIAPLTSYGQGVSPISKLRSEQDALSRLLKSASQTIINQLSAYFQRNK